MLTSNSENKIHTHESIQIPGNEGTVGMLRKFTFYVGSWCSLMPVLPSTNVILHVILKTKACKMCNFDFQQVTTSYIEAATKFPQITRFPLPLLTLVMQHTLNAATAPRHNATKHQTLDLHSRYRLLKPKYTAL